MKPIKIESKHEKIKRQKGKIYGDRIIKTPIGKYNIFPASNYIDVAIQDGDEITALEEYADRILQFKQET